ELLRDVDEHIEHSHPLLVGHLEGLVMWLFSGCEAAHACLDRVALAEGAQLRFERVAVLELPDAPRVEAHHCTARLSFRTNSGWKYGVAYGRFSKRKPPPAMGTRMFCASQFWLSMSG